MRVLGSPLSKRFEVAAFDRRGHGRTADTAEPFSYESMANETIAFLEQLKRRVNLVGHSDGANVAILVAMRRPDLVRRVVLVGANFHYRGLEQLEDFTPTSPGFAEWAEHYGTHSPDGAEHASVVVEKSLVLIKTQPTLSRHDLSTITVPVLVMAGDDDVAKLEHTIAMYEAIPESQLAIIPGSSHSVLKERTKDCVRFIEAFLLGTIPPVTKYPLRRGVRVSTN